MTSVRETRRSTPVGKAQSDIPHPYRLSTYHYDLPPDLIAQTPLPKRGESRLMLVRPDSGEIEHRSFHDLPSLLCPSDLLVFNETRVTPALLEGHKSTGGRVELLVLDPVRSNDRLRSASSTARECLVRSSKPLRPGSEIRLRDGRSLIAEETVSPGRVWMRFPVEEKDLLGFLESFGRPPLPPYIKSGNRDTDRDRSRYQTVYARVAGSVAAPTAGLHFDEELLGELERLQRKTVRILLHVGPGTFTPVRTEDIRLHRMEHEHYEIEESAAALIRRTLDEDGRVVAVGTTSVRALESAASSEGTVRPGKGSTDLFIMPGYAFRVVGGLLTNFHLPGSTLLALVCAFGGMDLMLHAYNEAIKERYRFYSYGDACLILAQRRR